MFFPSWKTGFKLSRHLLDTCSTPGYLSSFQTFSYRNLNRSSTTRWIDRESSWTLDSFSISGGLIELLFLCLYFIPRHLLDGFICRRCLSQHLPRQMAQHLYLSRITEDLYIGSSWFGSHFLDLSRSVYTCSSPKSLFLTPKLFSKWSSSIFKVFSSLGMSLFSHLHAFHVLKTRFWGFWKILGFFKIDKWLLKFWDGFLFKWV